MRWPLVGLLLLSMLTTAYGQAVGEVESIGFDGCYRPNCWTPMRIKLVPTTATSELYQLQVVQEDLDRDRVLYTRPITLTGKPEGRQIAQSAWVYFIPQPRELGARLSNQELNSILKVFLCDKEGRQLVRIPIPNSTMLLTNLDEPVGALNAGRGKRLVLMVVGNSEDQPILGVYNGAHGVNEDLTFVRIPVSDLPENSRGYEAVDAIAWLGADPLALNNDAAAAMQDYVRGGGRLVVCQDRENWQRMKGSPLAELLPVTVTGMADVPNTASLQVLAGLPRPKATTRPSTQPTTQPAAAATPKARLPLALAEPRNGAFVNAWSVEHPQSPYLARWSYGVGSVAWVAQHLGSKELKNEFITRRAGWEIVWDRVFDWPNRTVSVARQKMALSSEREAIDKAYEDYGQANSATDLSTAFLKGMELPQRGAALVALAMLFFVSYWLIAGPGSYFFLLTRKRANYSWPAFAVCAMAATLLTAGLVRLVLRGPPQIQHVTFLRVAPDGEAVAHSQFGLYIPRDGTQRIELTGAENRTSYLSPYPLHPLHLQQSAEFLAPLEYEVPVRSTGVPALEVPFRSTLKKMRVRWTGKFDGSIGGVARLGDSNLEGTLANRTGYDLHAVYMLYKPSADLSREGFKDDMLLFLPDSSRPAWPNGVVINLKSAIDAMGGNVQQNDPAGKRGALNRAWMQLSWSSRDLRQSDSAYSDADQAALLLGIFDRIEPVRAQRNASGYSERYEMHRLAGRQLDASAAVSAGHLLILAKATTPSPLPFALEIEGRRVDGEGTLYLQFMVPLQRSASATQPTGAPDESDDPPPANPAPQDPPPAGEEPPIPITTTEVTWRQ